MSVALTTQAFRYELAPTKAQARTLRFWCSTHRSVFNRFLAARNDWWSANKDLAVGFRSKEPTAYSVSRALTEALRANDQLLAAEQDKTLAGYRLVPRNIITHALACVEDAFSWWFKRGKAGQWTKPPRFKSGNNPREMRCGLQTPLLYFSKNALVLTKLGPVRVKEATCQLAGRPVAMSIKLKAGRWFAVVTCLDVPRETPERVDTERVGVDLGVRKLATLSTGATIVESVDAIANRMKGEKRIKRLQRSLDRKREEALRLGSWDKHRTSNAYKRTLLKLQRAHMKATDQRLDRSHKLSTHLVNRFRVVVIEDLNLQGLLRSARGTADNPGKNVGAKSRRNAALQRQCLGTVRRQLEYKANWYGATVETVPRFFASSKTCSGCGNVKQDLGSKETYHCDACGLTIDRDLNAAINIRDFSPEAQERLAAQPAGERVDCLKARKGAKAGPVKRSKKHVQDPQGKPDAGAIKLVLSTSELREVEDHEQQQ